MKTNESNEGLPRFDDLCAGFLDGTLEAEERDELLGLLRGDAGLRDELRRHLLVSGALARQSPLREDGVFERSIMGHLAAIRDEGPDAFPARVISRLRVLRVRRYVALAAAAVVALAVPFFWLSREEGVSGHPAEAVATLIPPGTGNEAMIVHVGDRFQLGAGVSKFEFANGAVLGVEGPADLAIRSGDAVFLAHGRLNAWCPESAHGFLVETPSTKVIDLGTTFGVNTGADGGSDVMVLDGLVRLDNGRDQRHLTSGAAMRAETGGDLREVVMETSAFNRTWPVALGIRSTTGEVAAAPAGTSETIASLEDDDTVFVIPERRDFAPTEPLRFNVVESGIFRANALPFNTEVTLEPGQKLRSYLLRYNPVGKVLDPAAFREFRGSVTFDRPVLGLIVRSPLLNRTDRMFSLAPIAVEDADYRTMRGLELAHPSPADSVVLSEDRYTVEIRWFAGESVDEIRVITTDD
jgi:hypothetical protein